MRISWGYKIAAVYILFVIGIMFLVFKASNQHFDLVTNDYYAKELKYQDIIDQRQNTADLSAPVTVTHTNSGIHVEFPQDVKDRAISGEIYLYCPSDAKKDLKRSFGSKDLKYQWIFPNNLSGLYELKLTWKDGNKSYYQEEKIYF